LTSKIINMADRLKDKEDRTLDALFSSESVRDDGFSARVVSRVRRQLWVRRLSLPSAFVIGAMFAAKPFFQLVEFIPQIVNLIPQGLTNVVSLPMSGMPQLSTIVLGIMLLAVAMMAGRMLEE